jgi:hypothetical protein
MKKRDAVARALAKPVFRQRVKPGAKIYSRKGRSQDRPGHSRPSSFLQRLHYLFDERIGMCDIQFRKSIHLSQGAAPMSAVSQKIEARIVSSMVAALRASREEIQYETDSKGRLVRKGTMTLWTTPEEIREFLLGNRVVEEDDALYALGANVWKTLINTGRVKKDARASYFWVCQAAADLYRLPEVIGCAFPA